MSRQGSFLTWSEQSGVVGFDDGEVVGAVPAEVAAAVVLGVKSVGGDHRVVQVEGVQQRSEGGNLVALVCDLALGQDASVVVHRGQQGDGALAAGPGSAQDLAVHGDRPQPALGAAVFGGAGGEEGTDRGVECVPSSWDSKRRTVCGAGTMPENGSGAKPRARRAQPGASVIHSDIALSDCAPARTLAAAAAISASRG